MSQWIYNGEGIVVNEKGDVCSVNSDDIGSQIAREHNVYDELVATLIDIHPMIESDTWRRAVGELIIKARGEQ